MVEVNWDISGSFSAEQALQILSGFRARFSDNLNKSRLQPVAGSVMLVRTAPDSRSGGPMRRIAGACDVDGDTLVFKPFGFDDRIFSELSEVGGSIVIDIDCDYLMTRTGGPVSGSASALIGLDTVPRPGGLLRLSIVIG